MIFNVNHQITQQLLLQFALTLLKYYICCSLLHPTNPLRHQLQLAKLNNQPNELNADNQSTIQKVTKALCNKMDSSMKLQLLAHCADSVDSSQELTTQSKYGSVILEMNAFLDRN
jgi:hypothetical protein